MPALDGWAGRQWDHRRRARCFPAWCSGRAGQPIHRSVRAGWRRPRKQLEKPSTL